MELGQEELKKLVKKEQENDNKKNDLEKLSNDLELIDDSILPNVSTESVFDGLQLNLRVLAPYDEIGLIKGKIEKEIVKRVREEEDLNFASRNYKITV